VWDSVFSSSARAHCFTWLFRTLQNEHGPETQWFCAKRIQFVNMQLYKVTGGKKLEVPTGHGSPYKTKLHTRL
jgi:hypothetical protein